MLKTDILGLIKKCSDEDLRIIIAEDFVKITDENGIVTKDHTPYFNKFCEMCTALGKRAFSHENPPEVWQEFNIPDHYNIGEAVIKICTRELRFRAI